jgi:hypothetical protein
MICLFQRQFGLDGNCAVGRLNRVESSRYMSAYRAAVLDMAITIGYCEMVEPNSSGMMQPTLEYGETIFHNTNAKQRKERNSDRALVKGSTVTE